MYVSLPVMCFLVAHIRVSLAWCDTSLRSIAALYNSGDLTVERMASGTGTYNYNDCFNAMTEMDTECNSRGGIKTLDGFQFTLDPNLGSC